MSWLDYQESKTYGGGDPSFYALIMAAMRKADSTNFLKLRRAWPDVWDELQERYYAPGGVLDSDPSSVKARAMGIDRDN